jgi:hypothetical protein
MNMLSPLLAFGLLMPPHTLSFCDRNTLIADRMARLHSFFTRPAWVAVGASTLSFLPQASHPRW